MAQESTKNKNYSPHIVIILFILFYISTRIIYYHLTSPKEISNHDGRSVYKVHHLLGDFLQKHHINMAKGSKNYIEWIVASLMGQIDETVLSDLKSQPWYEDYEVYATAYLHEQTMSEPLPFIEFLGYYTVVPRNMRNKSIKELERELEEKNR